MYEFSTRLHSNPFYILQVTTRDNGSKILEAAEERSLYLDPDVCNKARSDLTNPRARITAEVGWMPGVEPQLVNEFVSALTSKSLAIRIGERLPVLARTNWMSAIMELVKASMPSKIIAEAICLFASLVDKISSQEVLLSINADRAYSGFPIISNLSLVQGELAEHKKNLRAILKKLLMKLDSNKIIETMTFATETATIKGEKHAPALLDELVDVYEIETQSALEKEYDNIKLLIRRIRESAHLGQGAVDDHFDKLERVARNWDRFAQPIQVSSKSRGIVHKLSRDVAYDLRNLGIDLNNDHKMPEHACRMTLLLRELFAELPDVVERLTEDAKILLDNKNDIAKRNAEKAEWEKSIFFRAEVGLVFKDELLICAQHIQWKNKYFSLDSISRVRWGAVRNSVNGIPTGTDYWITFGDNHSEQTVHLRNFDIYTGFLDALWKGVCVRLIIDTLEKLSQGNSFFVGNMQIDDDSVVLVKHNLIGFNEKFRYNWSRVCLEGKNGMCIVRPLNETTTYGEASYINHDNTHIFENIIHNALGKGFRRLSDYLK